jgi:hypothetical protein
MNATLMNKILLVVVGISIASFMVSSAPQAVSQDRAAEGTKKADKAKGRLPAYYGDVVSAEQREEIYKIQAKYAPKVLELNEQLAALAKQQNDEIEAVLTAEQKAKIDEARKASVASKKKKSDSKKKASETSKTN